MDQTANLRLPYIMAAQAQKHVTHNEAIRALDAVVQLAVLDRDFTAPPASPGDGDRYVVAASATGAWDGQDNNIAAYQDGAWIFYAPAEGWTAWVADEDTAVVFDGSDWVPLTSGGGGATTFKALSDTPANFTGNASKLVKVNSGETALEFADQLPSLGINDAPDATNKLKVSSDAILLDHAGSDHRAVINKNAAANIASFLFQTNYSGRAEIGLTGDDDFHFKVSPDGTTFHEAILIDKDDGSVTFPNSSIGSGGATNLTVSRDGVSVSVESSTGTNASIATADASNAGILTAAAWSKLDGISGVQLGRQTTSLGRMTRD